jgi:hypothetical protein
MTAAAQSALSFTVSLPSHSVGVVVAKAIVLLVIQLGVRGIVHIDCR